MSWYPQMADHVLEIEAGYANHPHDRGGETICGISLVHWPEAEVWPLVDAQKARGEHPHVTPQMREAALRFYRPRFWDAVRGDDLQHPWIAYEVFEFGVNAHPFVASSKLQEALNLLNRNGRSWPEIRQDGRIGPVTLRTLQRALSERGGVDWVATAINSLQGEHYLRLMRERPTQEEFARGWLARTRPPQFLAAA